LLKTGKCSSSGFNFNTKTENEDKFEQVLEKIFLITPNYNEIDQLFADKSIVETIDYIQSKTNLLLKGGHRKTQIGKDQLFVKSGENFTMNPKMKNISEKHGSGCVLSSAITAYLALGFSLLKSCYRAKRYTEKVLSSNESLLGYHRI